MAKTVFAQTCSSDTRIKSLWFPIYLSWSHKRHYLYLQNPVMLILMSLNTSSIINLSVSLLLPNVMCIKFSLLNLNHAILLGKHFKDKLIWNFQMLILKQYRKSTQYFSLMNWQQRTFLCLGQLHLSYLLLKIISILAQQLPLNLHCPQYLPMLFIKKHPYWSHNFI